ncbi:MAG: sugar phosphate isomerase/epimerase family protein, partial [Pseudomonadota bacterium]
MSVSPSKLSLDRVAVHTITCKPMPLEQLCAALKDRGFGAISVWREAIEEAGGTRTAKAIIKDAGLEATALVRGGFLPSPDATERQSAIDENKRIIDEAAAINARMVVIVPGAHPEVDLSDARRMVTDGLGALTHHAQSAGVGLALEPLHPMYAGDRSCVNTLKQAREICNQLQSPAV